MLIHDTVNNMATFEPIDVVLERYERQMVSKYREHDRFKFARLISSFGRDWSVLSKVSPFKDQYEHLEHSVDLSVNTVKKYESFGKILEKYNHLFREIDFSMVKSIYMLDVFEIALDNHQEKDVMDALCSLSVRNFQRFARRLPIYVNRTTRCIPKDQIPNGKKDTRYIDFSYYNEFILEAFENGRMLMPFGTDMDDEWDRIKDQLRKNGISFEVREEGTPYASIVIR